MRETSKVRFESVREWSDEFLSLFPHRFDYIWAEHPNPNAAVEWKTESRHPLSDRLIQQGAYLYGVRFGAETNYCLLDIDAGSCYHAKQDPFAISRIAAALEPLGLVRYIACTSSYSGGLHLYFPFQHTQSSWQLAIAVACLLENAGFKLQPGQLEVFPNPKPYATDGNLSLFNAHRLPLQIGSYLLDEAFQPIWSNTQTFVRQWQLTQQRNDLNRPALKQILKQAKRKHFGVSGKAEKFINDLNAEIELGWTGPGQTNRLLGRITMRTYIFHHIFSGGEPLEGQALIDEIVETARSLPGYSEWCRHQHEIEHRAEEWARCIEGSHYFHFGDQTQKFKPEAKDPELADAIDHAPSWNQRQSAATRDRIRRAIADLLEQDQLPIRATARFQALLTYSIGGASLYRHRDLWHPNHIGLDSHQEVSACPSPVENPPHPPHLKLDRQLACDAAPNCLSPASLFPTTDGDNPLSQALSDSTIHEAADAEGNSSTQADSHSIASAFQSAPLVQQVLSEVKVRQEALQEAAQLDRSRRQRMQSETAQQRQVARMQQFLDSGDPILVAEAMAWAQANSGLLRSAPLAMPDSTDTRTQESADRVVLAVIEAHLQQLDGSELQITHNLQQQFGKDSPTE